MTKNLLQIQDLKMHFHTSDGVVKAVDGISIDIGKSENVAIVGESGCGKSVTALSIMRLTPGRHVAGNIWFEDRDILEYSTEELYKLRGKEISMIFQEPMTSLNPVYRVGDQIAESLVIHEGMNKKQALEKSTELLHQVGIPDPSKRIFDYPHQLSGGMRQRVMIAMGISCNPKLLIADEPTTALDVTIQLQILDLLRKLKEDYGMSIMLITHDLGVVAEIAEKVVVMYAGIVMEEAPVAELLLDPLHPYTEGLLKSIPRLSDRKRSKLNVIKGMVPSPFNMPVGCRFSNRCLYVHQRCKISEPPLFVVGEGRESRCWLREV